MSGVWVFKNGVMRLVENPYNQMGGAGESSSPESSSSGGQQQQRMRRKMLLHLPTGEVVSSYASLERILMSLGWERYYGGENSDLIQFHKKTSIDLISLPREFAKFNSIHMYDIVVKTPSIFHVRDM